MNSYWCDSISRYLVRNHDQTIIMFTNGNHPMSSRIKISFL
jgi:hypothetical protein